MPAGPWTVLPGISGASEGFAFFVSSWRFFRALARSSILRELKVQVAAMMAARHCIAICRSNSPVAELKQSKETL